MDSLTNSKGASMPPQTLTLGLMRVVTGGQDPAVAIGRELASFLKYEHHTKAEDWVSSTPQETRALSRGDVLWSGIAPIGLDPLS
jgi:hypothetical protein